jgi:hypothetical protein
MSDSPEHKRAKSTAGKVVRAWNALHKSAATWARPDYRKNMWGQYWKESDIERVESVYRNAIIEQTEDSDKFGLTYSLAALLQQCLRLDESAALCREMLVDRPGAYNFLALLAHVEAARGNLSEALRLAQEVDTIPNSLAFRVSVSELERLAKSGGVV